MSCRKMLPHERLTSFVKYFGVQALLRAALRLPSALCCSSSPCLCSVASSMLPSLSDLVTCCHNRLQARNQSHQRPSARVGRLRPPLPGLRASLFLERSQLLPGDRELSRVDHFGFAAAVGELQGSVPLPLRFTHDGVGRVVLHLRSHSKTDKGALAKYSEGKFNLELERAGQANVI